MAAGQALIGAGNQLRAEMTAAVMAAPSAHPHTSPMVGYGDVLASPGKTYNSKSGLRHLCVCVCLMWSTEFSNESKNSFVIVS